MKNDKLQIRCEHQTYREFNQVCAEIDPKASYADILELFMEVYRDDPYPFEFKYGKY